MPDRFEAAAHRITVVRSRPSWTSPLRILSMLCDVILDDSVQTVATNGVDLLVSPTFAGEAPEEDLAGALEMAVRDAVALLPEAPHGLPWRGPWWSYPGHTGGVADRGERLREPPPGVDLAACWGRRRCWMRQFLQPALTSGYQDPLLPQGTCLACGAGEHRPLLVPPQFRAILQGSHRAPAHVPLFAEECFCLVWVFTSPAFSAQEQLAALQWLVRCGATEWALLAIERLAVFAPGWLDGALWRPNPELLARWQLLRSALPRPPELPGA